MSCPLLKLLSLAPSCRSPFHGYCGLPRPERRVTGPPADTSPRPEILLYNI